MRFAAVASLILLAAVARTDAGPFDGLKVGRPLVLELDGRFVADGDEARAGGVDAVTVAIGDRTRWLAVATARTTAADPPPVSGRSVLSALAPIHPNLLARGDAALVRRLGDAPDGAQVHLEGMIDRGSRTYLLRAVEVREASTP